MINTADVEGPAGYGVVPSHFVGYKDEYQWILTYHQTYHSPPSRDAFLHAFPDFSLSKHEGVRSACDMVFKAHAKRSIREAMNESLEMLALDDVQAAFSRLMEAKPLTTAPPAKPLLTDMEFLDDWDVHIPTIEVPYPSLQRVTGGIRPGNLWYFAARPGEGKSAHMCNLSKSAVLQGKRVKFYSLEMPEHEVRARFHAALATHFGYKGITLTDIRDRRVDKHDYKTFVGELQDRLEETGGGLDIFTPAQGLCTPAQVASTADEYDLNIVDYHGLMRNDAGIPAISDWRVAAEISNRLKEVALSASTRVLAAAQINREGGKSSKPSLESLSQTDALGQDGDVVVMMRAKPHNVATGFYLEKNRHGPNFVEFYTTFDPDRGLYSEIGKEMAEDLVIAAEDR